MTVRQDPQGWTEITPSNGGREIHVAESGSDANAGSSPDSPMRTVGKALSYYRDGHGDHICLKSGDSWNEPIGKWIWSGESAQNPACVRVYGGVQRARLLTGPSSNGIHFEGGGGAPPRLEHVAFQGIDFRAVGRSGKEECHGVSFLRPVNNVLFEDCRWRGYGNGVILSGAEGPLNNVRLRRCVILDSWGEYGHVQGLYAFNITGLSLFECVLDHNGWNPNIFRHNLYLNNGCGPATVEGCVISQPSSHGLQLLSGGRVKDNLFLRCPVALELGGGQDPDPNGVGVTVKSNLILEGRDIDASHPRGWGMQVSNIARGSITHNLMAHNGGGQPSGLRLKGEGASGIHDLTVENNMTHRWGAGLEPSGDLSTVSQRGNSWEAPDSMYLDSTRGIPSYLKSIGWTNGTTNDFIAGVREQSRANWNRKFVPTNGLMRHMWDGFRRVA